MYQANLTQMFRADGTGDRFDAAEALRLGLVDRLCGPAGLDETVSEVVGALLRGGPADGVDQASLPDISEGADPGHRRFPETCIREAE